QLQRPPGRLGVVPRLAADLGNPVAVKRAIGGCVVLAEAHPAHGYVPPDDVRPSSRRTNRAGKPARLAMKRHGLRCTLSNRRSACRTDVPERLSLCHPMRSIRPLLPPVLPGGGTPGRTPSWP